jgi:hypothetical protein
MKRPTHFFNERGGRNCILIFFICIFSFQYGNCQFSNTANAASEGIANASIAIPEHTYALQSIAGSAFTEEVVLSSNYKNYYLLPNVHSASVSALIPFKSWTVGLYGQKMGPPHYQETQTSISIASVINHTALGLRTHWNQLAAEGFKTQHAVVFEFGGITKINSKLNFGASICNFTLAKLEQKVLPVILRSGLSGYLNSNLLLCIEAHKNIYSPLLIKVGAIYQIHHRFKISTGYTFSSSSLHGGFTAVYRNFNISYSVVWQIRLGLGQTFSICYSVKRKSK